MSIQYLYTFAYIVATIKIGMTTEAKKIGQELWSLNLSLVVRLCLLLLSMPAIAISIIAHNSTDIFIWILVKMEVWLGDGGENTDKTISEVEAGV